MHKNNDLSRPPYENKNISRVQSGYMLNSKSQYNTFCCSNLNMHRRILRSKRHFPAYLIEPPLNTHHSYKLNNEYILNGELGRSNTNTTGHTNAKAHKNWRNKINETVINLIYDAIYNHNIHDNHSAAVNNNNIIFPSIYKKNMYKYENISKLNKLQFVNTNNKRKNKAIVNCEKIKSASFLSKRENDYNTTYINKEYYITNKHSELPHWSKLLNMLYNIDNDKESRNTNTNKIRVMSFYKKREYEKRYVINKYFDFQS